MVLQPALAFEQLFNEKSGAGLSCAQQVIERNGDYQWFSGLGKAEIPARKKPQGLVGWFIGVTFLYHTEGAGENELNPLSWCGFQIKTSKLRAGLKRKANEAKCGVVSKGNLQHQNGTRQRHVAIGKHARF